MAGTFSRNRRADTAPHVAVLASVVLAGRVLAVVALAALAAGCARVENTGSPAAASVPSAAAPKAEAPKPSAAAKPSAIASSSAPSAVGTSRPPAGAASVGPEEGTYTPKQFGPGVVLVPNLDTAPVVPRGMTVDAYIGAYYKALLAKDWARAMKMVPAENPKDTVKQFVARTSGYEASAFRVVTAGVTNGIGAARVDVTTSKNGVWSVTWEFVTTKRGLVVKTLKYGRIGQNGCH